MLKQLKRQHVFNYVFNNFADFLDAQEHIESWRLAVATAEHFRDLGFSTFVDGFGKPFPNALIISCISYIAEAYNAPMCYAPIEAT